MEKNHTMLRWLWLSLVAVALDQAAKIWVEAVLQPHESLAALPFFNLTLVYNQGAAFSFLADQGGWQRWFFALLAVVASIILILWLRRLKPQEWLTAAALSLVIGGAVGNLIDRVLYGKVTDFLDFYLGAYHWPAFNLADSAIFLGVALLIGEAVFPPGGKKEEGNAKDAK